MKKKCLFLLFALLCGSQLIYAQTSGTLTWTGTVNNTWDGSTANWSGASTQWIDGNNAVFNANTSGTITISSTVVAGAGIDNNNNYINITGTYVFTGTTLTIAGGKDNKINILGANTNVTFNNLIQSGPNSTYFISNAANTLTLNGGVISGAITSSGRGNNQLYFQGGSATMNLTGGNYYGAYTNISVATMNITGNTNLYVQQVVAIGNTAIVLNSSNAQIVQLDGSAINSNIIGQSNNTASLHLQNGQVNLQGGLVLMSANNTSTQTGSLIMDGGTMTIQNYGITMGYSTAAGANGNAAITINNGLLQTAGITFGGAAAGSSLGTTTSGVLTVTGGTLNIGAGGINKGTTGTLTNNTINLSGGTIGILNGVSQWSSNMNMILSTGSRGNVTFSAYDSDYNARQISLSGILSGTGGLNVSGGTLLLQGANTYTGNTVVNSTVDTPGLLQLASGAQLTFKIGASGINNFLSGNGAVYLDGNFLFDLSGAGNGASDSWTIISGSLLNSNTFGADFSVIGFTDNGGIWSNGIYQFNQNTGILSVIPEPSVYALLAVGFFAMILLRKGVRRRKQSSSTTGLK